MKELVKASAVLAIAQVAALLIKLVNTKVLAVLLGPYGVGIYNQIGFFFVWMLVFVALGTRQGIIKYVSEHKAKGNYEEIKKIVVTLGIVLVSFSLVITVLSFLFADHISFLLFGSAEYSNLITIVTLAIPQGILMGFYYSLVQGVRPIKQISFIMLSEAVLGFVFLIPMVYFWGVKGAVGSFILIGLCQLGVVWWIYHKQSPVKVTLLDFKLFELKSIYEVINYGFIHLIVQVVQYLVITILFRRLIITSLGIEANGIYSPAYGLASQAVLLVKFTVYIYSFSIISEAKELWEISNEVNNLLRVSLLIMTPVFYILISYRKWLVLFLYTDKFLPVTSIMPLQFIGDFFKVIGLAFALPIFARAKLKAMLGFDVISHFIFYLIASVAVPIYGLLGAAGSYTAMYVLYALAVLPYIRRHVNFEFEKINYLLMGLSLLILIIASKLNLSFQYSIVTTVVILGAWCMIVLTEKEKRYAVDKLVDLWAETKKIKRH